MPDCMVWQFGVEHWQPCAWPLLIKLQLALPRTELPPRSSVTSLVPIRIVLLVPLSRYEPGVEIEMKLPETTVCPWAENPNASRATAAMGFRMAFMQYSFGWACVGRREAHPRNDPLLKSRATTCRHRFGKIGGRDSLFHSRTIENSIRMCCRSDSNGCREC